MEKEQKITLARIIVSLLMLAGAWLFESDENIVKIIFYAAAYLVIGGDIVFNAVRNVFHGEIFDENFLMAVATIGAFATGQYPEAVAVMLFYQVGEMFQDIAADSQVLSGSLNMTGLLKIRTSGTYGESTVARILDLVENADTGKAKTEKFITRFAKYYTPAVVGAAVLLAILPSLIDGQWLTWLNRALIFLVISCPCALVVSIPLTFFAGIGGASRRGILIKGSNYLEALSRLGTVVFDKTGTLTKGDFNVTSIVPFNGCKSADLLTLAASAEVYSDHPVAVALRKACGREIVRANVSATENFAGEGIRAKVGGRSVLAGNDKLMLRFGVNAYVTDQPGTIVSGLHHHIGYNQAAVRISRHRSPS